VDFADGAEHSGIQDLGGGEQGFPHFPDLADGVGKRRAQ
jgi:hypothetical protein